MGQSQSVFSQIEIAGSPETVRSVFLDFQHYKDWNPGWVLTPLDSGKQPTELQPGDRIKVDVKGMAFRPVIVENSSGSFQWLGDLYGLFTGTHQFYFSPSTKTPGNTTLVQKEDFGGLFAFLCKPGWSMAKETQANFEEFNVRLKEAVEKVGS